MRVVSFWKNTGQYFLLMFSACISPQNILYPLFCFLPALVAFKVSMDEVSYCELVEYKFQEKEIRGGKGFVFLPGEGRMTPSQINQQKTLAWDYEMKKGKNNFQKFIHDHQRFDYIFGNNVGSPR